jgi:hypothetical protein
MTPPTSLRLVKLWFGNAADEAASAGKGESAQLWRDGLAQLEAMEKTIHRQKEAFLDLLADTCEWSYEGEGERDAWIAKGTVPLDTAAIDFGFDDAQEAFDLIDET